MTKIYGIGERPKRFAALNQRASSAQYLNSLILGQPAPQNWKAPEFRVRFKYGTSPPLGDCPHNPHLVIFSNRAVAAFTALLPQETQLLPVSIIGGESERKSGIHYNVDLSDCADIEGINEPYFLVHMSRAYTERSGPKQPSRIEIAESMAQLFELMAAKGRGADLERLKVVFGSDPPPAIFAFGEMASIYFSQPFVDAVKKCRLKGFTFEELVEVGNQPSVTSAPPVA